MLYTLENLGFTVITLHRTSYCFPPCASVLFELFLILVLRKVSFFGLHSCRLSIAFLFWQPTKTLMLTWRRQHKIRGGGGIQPYNYKQDTLKNILLKEHAVR